MKVKPLYIYAAIIILAILFLVIFASKDKNEQNAGTDFSTKNLPDDEIHKGLQNPSTQTPSKENVNENFKHQIEMLKKAAEENPSDTLKMREYADLLFAAHKAEEAIPYYQKILKVNPKRIDILFSVSFIYYNKKDFDKSEEITNQILKADKKNQQALYNLGAIAIAKGDIQSAKKIWTRLIEEYPSSETSELAKNSLNKL